MVWDTEPDQLCVPATISQICLWRPAKPRTGQIFIFWQSTRVYGDRLSQEPGWRFLQLFCMVSTICLLGYFFKFLFVILFIDGILFWGLFEPVSDRD